MGQNSPIEWTDHTFNPWWGCTKVSPGCKFCYAERLSNRYAFDVWGPGAKRRTLSDSHWDAPRRWNRAAERNKRPARVFCASMADVFDEGAPRRERQRLWREVKATPHLRWQLLTKRPELILEFIPKAWRSKPPANVWYGTSVEDNDHYWRIEELARVPAVLRFLSVEPLLGPVPKMPLAGVHWVIVGGESGPNARPMEPEWVLDIQAQCERADIPFFFKQWGGRNKKATGRALAGRTHDTIPIG